MTFCIKILNQKPPKDLFIEGCENRGIGYIQIGSFKETFYPSFDHWNKKKYEKQWKEGIERIISGKYKTSAVIDDMPKFPYKWDLLVWWPMYRIGDTVYFHQQLKILKRFKKPFETFDIYKYIPKRQREGEDGAIVSEWSISVNELKQFYAILLKNM